MQAITEKLKTIVAYIIIALAVFGVYSLWHYFNKREKPISFINSIEKEKQVISSYAFVGVAFYNVAGKEYRLKSDDPIDTLYDDWYIQEKEYKNTDKKAPKIKGVCYKIYKVAFGYENLTKALDGYSKGKNSMLPSILGVETVKSRYAGDIDQFACESLDFEKNVAKREKAITNRLLVDGYYQYHLNNGCQTLGALTLDKNESESAALYNNCISLAEKDTNESNTKLSGYILFKYSKEDKDLKDKLGEFIPRQIMGPYVGDIASVKVTLSTLNLNTRGRWILNHIYFRRDITEVNYGNSLYEAKVTSGLFSREKRVDIYVSPVKELYRNTYIASMYKNYDSDKKLDAEDMDSIVKESVNTILGEHKQEIYSFANDEFVRIVREHAHSSGYELGHIEYRKESSDLKYKGGL